MNNLFTKTGKEIVEKSNETENKVSRTFLNSGDSIVVRIPSVECFVEYFSHMGYSMGKNHKIYPSVCTRHTGTDDAYCKAVNVLYEDLDALKAEIEAGNEEKQKEHDELKTFITDIRATRKILFGLFELETGKEIILELTGNQGNKLITLMLEFAESLDDYAFKIMKIGEGTDTTVNLVPIIKMTAEQKENFKALDGLIFDESLFGKSLFVKDEKFKIKDLQKIGFDVTRIGEIPMHQTQQQQQQQEQTTTTTISDTDLPF